MLAKALILLIRVYQWTLSPLIGGVCRFEPSCSHYAVECLRHHGALAGSWLSLKRLARCHPFNPGGYDPPPPPRTDQPDTSSNGECVERCHQTSPSKKPAGERARLASSSDGAGAIVG